jgi:hypothetical protein
MELVLTLVLALSVAGNAFLGLRLKEKLKKQPTYDATELLRNLVRGDALIVVRCVDPENVFIRSVRS